MLSANNGLSRPLVVKGPNDTWISRLDLPKRDDRWVKSRKIRILFAIQGGLLTTDEALKRYDLSEAEINKWRATLLTEAADIQEDAPVVGDTPRLSRTTWAAVLNNEPEFVCGGITLNPPRRAVKYRDMTAHMTEMRMMLLLVITKAHPNVVEKHVLYETMWGSSRAGPGMKIVDVGMCHLRKSLRTIGLSCIETSWGRGYRLVLPADISN